MSNPTSIKPAQKVIWAALWTFDQEDSTDKYFKQYCLHMNQGVLAHKANPTADDEKILDDLKDQFHALADKVDAVELVKKFIEEDADLAFSKYCKSIGLLKIPACDVWKKKLCGFFKKELIALKEREIFDPISSLRKSASEAEADAAVAMVEDDSDVAPVEDDSEQAMVEDISEVAPVEDDSEQVMVEDDSEQVVAEDDSEQAMAEDDSEQVPAEDDSEQVMVEDDSEQVVAEDDSEQAVAEDDSEQAVAEDDSEQVPAEDDSEQAEDEDSDDATEKHLLAQLEALRKKKAVKNEERDTAKWAKLVPAVVELLKTGKRSFARCEFLKPLFKDAPKTEKFKNLFKKLKAIKAEVNIIEKQATKKRAWAKTEMISALQGATKKMRTE